MKEERLMNHAWDCCQGGRLPAGIVVDQAPGRRNPTENSAEFSISAKEADIRSEF